MNIRASHCQNLLWRPFSSMNGEPSIQKPGILSNGSWRVAKRALFSMLFGARGIILFVTRQEKSGPADYFLRRQLWLMVFGLFNAFILLWFWGSFSLCLPRYDHVYFPPVISKSINNRLAISLLLMTARENLDAFRDRKMIAKEK